MTITYRDKLGFVTVFIDEYGVQFENGLAIFSDGIVEYRVPVFDLIEITNE